MTDEELLMADMTEAEYLAYDADKAAEIERLADVEGSPHP